MACEARQVHWSRRLQHYDAVDEETRQIRDHMLKDGQMGGISIVIYIDLLILYIKYFIIYIYIIIYTYIYNYIYIYIYIIIYTYIYI